MDILSAEGTFTFLGVPMKFTFKVTGTPTEALKRVITEPDEVDVSAGPQTVKTVGVGMFGTRFPVTIDSLDPVPAPFTASFSGDTITIALDPALVTSTAPVSADITGDAH